MQHLKSFSLAVLMLLYAASAATAQSRSRTRIGVEMGVIAGASYSMQSASKLVVANRETSFSAGLSLQGGLHFALLIGKHFAIQPEVIYSRISIKATQKAPQYAKDQKDIHTTIKSNNIHIPLLFSARLGGLRLEAGPVFNIVQNPSYWYNDEKWLFGNICPTVSYTAGISMRMARYLLLSLRYSGQFNSTQNNFLEQSLRLKRSSLSFRVGFIF